jgi:CBS domain-containing protein
VASPRVGYAAHVAALDPVSFLRSTPPFDGLPSARFEGAARSLEIVFHGAGARLVHRGGEPLGHLYVIRKGAVRLERDAQLLQLLEQGEVFGYTSLITGKATIDVIVEEDLLAYRLPRATFQALLADAAFAGHFAVGLAERLKNSLERTEVATFQADLNAPVETLVRRAPAWVAASATVGEAARAMREERITSLLVDADPPGIVTDKDFRNRVLAEGRGPETPLVDVYSHPLRTLPASAAIYEAWQQLLDSGVHHLPLTRGGAIVGLVTSTDLLKCTAQGPVAVLRRVERLATRDALPGYGAKVTEMASALLAGGLDPGVIAGFVVRLNGTLLTRILRWAEADLGPPPCRYAWLAFGSEGRREQTLLTDQDNALVYERDGADAREYFAALAERANSDLEAAGFPRCPGGYMARHWRASLDEWVARFHDWINDPKPQALLEAAIFFDFRRAHGDLDVAPLEAAVRRAREARNFVPAMAKAALVFRPPTGLLLRLRGDGELDLKFQGISPIVFLTRCYALEAGVPERNTLERLDAVVRSGLMAEEVKVTIREAYRFLLALRLREQIRMLSEGKQPVNRISFASLSSIERSRLKESFRAIRSWQEKAAFHYRTEC